MNLLTDEDIAKLNGDGDNTYSGDIKFARAVIAADRAKLAAGVSVGPDTSTYSSYNDYPAYTVEAFNTAVAAARVQAIQECNDAIFDLSTEAERADYFNAIRALLGKEAQS